MTSHVNNTSSQSEAPELPARLYKRENGVAMGEDRPLGTNAASLPCFYDRLEQIRHYPATSSTHTASDLSPVSSNGLTEASRPSDAFFPHSTSGGTSLASPTVLSLSARSTPVPNELQLRSFRPREVAPPAVYPPFAGSDVTPMTLQSPRRVGGIVTSPMQLRPDVANHHHMRRLSPRSTRYDAPALNRQMTSPTAPAAVVKTMAPLPEYASVASTPFAYHQPQHGLKRRPSLNERYTAIPTAAFDPTQTNTREPSNNQSAIATQHNNKHNSLPRRGLRDKSGRDAQSDVEYAEPQVPNTGTGELRYPKYGSLPTKARQQRALKSDAAQNLLEYCDALLADLEKAATPT